MVTGQIAPAPGYAIGLLTRVSFGPGIQEYLERIDFTLGPYLGRFLIHGGTADVLEGPTPGDVIVIEFPSIEAARDWYGSDAYQATVSLRKDNADGTVLLIEGVEAGHFASEVLPGAVRRSVGG